MALTRIMEAIEEWVEDQKGMINEVEKIQRGYDMQRIVVKGAEGVEGGTKAVGCEEKEWRERMKNRKDEGVQTSEEEGKGKDKEVEKETGPGSDKEADGEGDRE